MARLNAPHPDAWPGPLARGVADADIDGRIDPSITGFERQVMEKVMLLLPPRERGGNVTFVDEDGTIYVNKPALRNVSVRQVTPSPQSGRVMTQGLQLPGGFDALTGPFRRVYTSNPAATYGGGGPPLWALGSASVNIPCARPASEIGTVSNLWQDYWPFLSYGATGFAYLEAFDDNDSNYEVGLQYYPDGNNKMGDWTPYYNMRTGTGEIQISPQGDSSHLQCNSEVDLGIAVQSSHIIYGTIAGTTITNVYVSYPGQNVAINSPVVPPTPPPINVASIRFARMTTIAFDAKKIQGSGYAFIYNGSDFGLDINVGDPTAINTITLQGGTPFVHWYNGAEEAMYCIQSRFLRRCPVVSSGWQVAGYQNYPVPGTNPLTTPADSNPSGNTYIHVKLISPNEEYDGIVLPKFDT